MTSKIEWTEETWNPVTGCVKVSQGCKNCYAERFAKRLQAMGTKGYAQGFKPTLHPDRLHQPLKWRKPRTVFVCSMSDLFQEVVPDEFLDSVWSILLACALLYNRQHTFQVLTKRPERMAAYLQSREAADHLRTWSEIGDGLVGMDDPNTLFSEHVWAQCAHHWKPDGTATDNPGEWGAADNLWPLPNVWLGTSVEDQATADKRIPHLLRCPAAVRFLSCEPLLGPIPKLNLTGIHWVIVGGESGPGARPCRLEWIREIVARCRAADVPVFVKQVGTKPETDEGPPMRCSACGDVTWTMDHRDVLGADPGNTFCQQCNHEEAPLLTLRQSKGGDPSEWPPDLRIREMP